MGGHTALELSRQELHLILLCRQMRFGELTIKVQDGLPVMVVEACRKIKLGGEEFEKVKEGVNGY